VRGRCSYTAQDAWIQNASLRDNVLMGQPWDRTRYRAVVAACALQPDIDLLAAGATDVVRSKPRLETSFRQADIPQMRRGVQRMTYCSMNCGRHLPEAVGPGATHRWCRIALTQILHYLAQPQCRASPVL